MKTPKRHGAIKRRFQELKEFVLEWHGSEDAGGQRVIGRTDDGRAVALVCEDPPSTPGRDELTHRKMDLILDEAKAMGLGLPVHIWANASTAPISADLYRFHQIAVWPLPAPDHNPTRTST